MRDLSYLMPKFKSDYLLSLIPPLDLGLGIYFSSIPIIGAVIYLHYYWKNFNLIRDTNKIKIVTYKISLYSGICILFFGCYWAFYIPYHPQIYSLSKSYFPMLISLWLIGSIWILTLKSEMEYIQFIWIFCFGCFIFSAATIGVSVGLEPPPYYGRLINILSTKIFSARNFINSPGVANLLTFFPIAFVAGLLLKPVQRPKGFWLLGGICFVISLPAALAIGQRSYFVITLILCPLIVGALLAIQGAWNLAFRIFLLLACYPILWFANSLLSNNLLSRPINSGIVNDGRFQMLSYWIKNFIHDPFTRIEVGPGEWQVYQWFHNFFADVHRLSGFWALAAALLLFGYIFIRLIVLIRVDKHIGCFLMAIAIPVFLILNTSVVPEGERQPFLLMLFIGLICELVLANRKSTSPLVPKA